MNETYGAKCARCACLDHRDQQAVEPIPWLSDRMHGLRCPDCSFCQSNELHGLLMEVGWDVFDPAIREAVTAVRDGKPHPMIDRLRIECLALGAEVEVSGESWRVADAQFDDAEVGAHLHLTLTRALTDECPVGGPHTPQRIDPQDRDTWGQTGVGCAECGKRLDD